MGKTAGKTETISKTNVPTFQQPFVKELLNQAQSLYQGSGPNYYPGSTVAPLSGTQQQGLDYVKKATNDISSIFGGVSPAIHTGLTAYDVSNNPALAKAAQGAIRPVMDQLTQQVLPQLRSHAIGTGNAGSTREGIAEGLATKGATQQAFDTTSAMYNNAYARGLNSLVGTLGMIPSLTQANLAPTSALMGAGNVERSAQQQALDAAFKKYMYEQGLPYNKLAQYANIVRSPFGGTASSTVTASPPDKIAQILGDVLTGGAVIPGLIGEIRKLFGGG